MVVVVLGACQASTSDNAVLQLRNDTGSRVVLTACEDFHCHHAGGSVKDHLAPGETLPVNVATDGVVTYYRLDPESGGPSTCLSLAVTGSQQGGEVALSSATDCRQPSRVALPAGTTAAAGQSLVSTVIGWAFYLLLVLFGLASVVATTVFAYRRLRAHGLRDAALLIVTAVVAGAAFLGLWVVADVYFLGRAVLRLFHRATPRTA